MCRGPTKRQLEVYDFIVDYMTEHQYSPTIREICKGVGLKSTSSALSHMEALRDWGMIDYQSTQPRTIKIRGYGLKRL